MNGSKIEFEMSDTPNKQRGISEDSFPYSFSNDLPKSLTLRS
jgi:putative alpha-1,2-mannosidase